MHITGPRPWLSLFVSAVFEVVWIVSLKMTNGFARLVPLVVYAVSGLGAAVFLSIALKRFRVACALMIIAGTCGLRWSVAH